MLKNDFVLTTEGPMLDQLREEAIAVVGFARTHISHLKIRNQFECHTSYYLEPLIFGIRRCLDDLGISLTWLQARNAAPMIGISDPFQSDGEPIMIAPRVADELGLAHPGMTVEVGEASGMAAIHFAKSQLTSGKCRFAIVAELQSCASEDQDTVNVMLLQHLGDALQDGLQVHGLVKSSAMAFGANAESLLAECCGRAALARERVLRIESKPANAMSSMFEWMDDSEDLEPGDDILAATGFSAYASNGTRVSLLLQAPLVSPQVGHDAAQSVTSPGDSLEEEETRDVPAYGRMAPYYIHLAHEHSDSRFDMMPDDLPGRTCLGLKWPGSMDTPMFFSTQQGEV